jgi:hypothetical protein
MLESETTAELTAEDIAKLNEQRVTRGCLWILAVPAVLIFLFFLFTLNWSTFPVNSALIIAATIFIPLLILTPLYIFIKKRDRQIDADIAGGRKKIIVAPIAGKRIESSDITSGRNKGGVSMKYFMTVAGREYPMTEHKYLKIPVGEFMEIHLAPVSETVVRERWLKQDEPVEKESGGAA